MKKNYNDYAVDELVTQYKQERNESVFVEIMEKTKGLIYVFARSYTRSIIGAELEDLVSEGDLVLWDAIQTFDDTRECSFTTYLCGCLKRNYNTLFSMANCQKRNPGCFVHSYEQINTHSEYEEEGDSAGASEFSVECEDYDMVEMKMLLDSLELSDNERVVINLLLMGKSKPDIARKLGVKTPSVHSYVKRIGKKLIAAGICA